MVGSFNRGRAKNRDMHELLIDMFNLQISYDFLLSHTWVPTAANGVADAISRPSRETLVQLGAAAFSHLWADFGTFDIGLMTCSTLAQRSSDTGVAIPFFSRFHCDGIFGVDVLAKTPAVLPGTEVPAYGFCFPPPVPVGHIVQRLAEYRAHAGVLVPGVKACWFPRVQFAAVRSVEVAAVNAAGVFRLPSFDGALRPRRYPRWCMVA